MRYWDLIEYIVVLPLLEEIIYLVSFYPDRWSYIFNIFLAG